MKKLIPVVALYLFLSSCYNDKADKLYVTPTTVTCDTASVSFATVILPILQSKCTSSACHATGGTSGYDFTTYSSVLTGQARNGNLVGDITAASGHNAMPQSGPALTSCEIEEIIAWVNQGYQNN